MASTSDYNPAHKTSSVSSTSSYETVPSLASSSVCDIDSPAIQDFMPYDDSNTFITATDPPALYESIPTTSSPLVNETNPSYPFLELACTKQQPQPLPSVPIYLHCHDAQSNNQPTHVRPDMCQFTSPLSTYRTPTPANDTSPLVSRDLLSESERRANHIASEQKRRNMIRTGFKDMVDIVPTLKNVNNSKSTVLFKAAEYIRHLEKRNRGLRDKLQALQLRFQVAGQMQTSSHLLDASSYWQPHVPNKKSRSMSLVTPVSASSSVASSTSSSLSPHALAALIAHGNQQRQLEQLQEQLRFQQALLVKHNIPTSSTSSFHPSLAIPITDQPSFASSTSSSTPPISFHHRASAPALVMPTTSQLGSPSWSSVNIPADQ